MARKRFMALMQQFIVSMPPKMALQVAANLADDVEIKLAADLVEYREDRGTPIWPREWWRLAFYEDMGGRVVGAEVRAWRRKSALTGRSSGTTRIVPGKRG